MIDMKGIEISRETSKDDDIGFRYGTPWAFPLVTDYKIIE